MKNEKITYGVAARLHGQYWGYQEGGTIGFGPFENAKVVNPDFCKSPTDMRHEFDSEASKALLYHPDAKLVKVKRTLTLEVVEG